MISESDIRQLQTTGRSKELIERQYEYLTGEKQLISGIRPALLDDGIVKMKKEDIRICLEFFNDRSYSKRWIKFVPASGVASRMFEPFHTLQYLLKQKKFEGLNHIKSIEGSPIIQLKKQIKKLPFFQLIHTKISNGKNLQFYNSEDYFKKFINFTLSEFQYYPKGLIPFFIDLNQKQWTPFEAHLLETIHLSQQNNLVPLHLSIDKYHRKLFDEALEGFKKKIPEKTQLPFYVEYSNQHRLTDTPFIDEKKHWVRDNKGAISFRKGGHGALLENINRLNADYIWIKNIDNILLGKANKIGELWMKIIAGKLLLIQEKLFGIQINGSWN